MRDMAEKGSQRLLTCDVFLKENQTQILSRNQLKVTDLDSLTGTKQVKLEISQKIRSGNEISCD